MADKEKKPKKEKKPREKKEKKPKVKKEKAPKPKKEKAPKPKKEKKTKKPKTKKADAGGEGEEAEESGKGGGKKKLLILLPVIVAVAAAAVLLVPRLLGGSKGASGEDAPPAEETSEVGEEGEEGEGEDPEATETPAPRESLQIQTSMTTAEVVDYIGSLAPADLGLEGEDMSGYDVFASESVILVDGRMCTQVRVYGDGPAGTNEILGTFFLSRDAHRILYRYDSATGTVEQLDIKNARYDADSGTVTLTEEETPAAETEASETEAEETASEE